MRQTGLIEGKNAEERGTSFRSRAARQIDELYEAEANERRAKFLFDCAADKVSMHRALGISLKHYLEGLKRGCECRQADGGFRCANVMNAGDS